MAQTTHVSQLSHHNQFGAANPAKHDPIRSHPERNAPRTQASSSSWESKGPTKQRIRNSTMGGSGSDQRGPRIRRLQLRGPRRRRGQPPSRRRIELPLLPSPTYSPTLLLAVASRSPVFFSPSVARGFFAIDSTARGGCRRRRCHGGSVRARRRRGGEGEDSRRRAEMVITCCLLFSCGLKASRNSALVQECAVSGREKAN